MGTLTAGWAGAARPRPAASSMLAWLMERMRGASELRTDWPLQQGAFFNVHFVERKRSPGLSIFNNCRSEPVPRYQARVLVHLRPSVLDPAGEAARAAASRLGVDGVERLRIGKAVELELEASDEAEARRHLELLSDRLLANPVIENWTLELTQS